jgi:hypothetical protein
MGSFTHEETVMAASHQKDRRDASGLPFLEKGLFTSQPGNEPRRISRKRSTPTAAKVQPVNEHRGRGFRAP